MIDFLQNKSIRAMENISNLTLISWLIIISHSLYFLMIGVLFFASIKSCRGPNGVSQSYRCFVTAVMDILLRFFFSL
jgi:hypothetical protein